MKKTAAKKAAAKVAPKKAASHAVARITDDMTVVVVKNENPFRAGTIQADKARVVLASAGKTVGAVKHLRDGLVDSWAVREMVKRGVIKVAAPKPDAAH